MGHAAALRDAPSSHVQRSIVTTPRAERVANTLVDILAEAGVEVVFGLPGGAIAPFQDALLDRTDIRLVTTRQEAGAVFAAAGYAQATGRLGVVAVTSGPGILNALTGMASALSDGLPLLVLAGEVPKSRFGKGAFQEGSVYELDIVGGARRLAKLTAELREPASAAAVLQQAIATALDGRKGPVLLTLPVDVTTAFARRPHVSVPPLTRLVPNARAIVRASELLAEARRGVIFAGSGARWGEGPRLVRTLAETLQLPVMTSPKGKGVFPETHPLSLGVFGWGGHPSASEHLAEGADVILALGTSLGEVATNNWSPLLEGAELVQIDVDPSVFGRTYPVSVGLTGTIGEIVPALLAEIPRRARAARAYGIAYTEADALQGDEGRLAPQRAIRELQQALPRETRFTSDIGEHMMFAIHHLVIDDPRAFTFMSGIASMGSGIASALGVKLANPGHPVAAICGDGGFAMAVSDLATAAQERLPIVFAVLNDERYGMVEIGNGVVFGRTPSFAHRTLDIPEVARGMGAVAETIRAPGEILALDLPAMLSHGPVVLDIRTDRSIQLSRARLDFLRKNQSGIRSRD